MTEFANEAPYALTAVSAPETLKLYGARAVDFVLVGAGYGGLLTAIDLAERGAAVAIVEARQIGEGGSGRNHGQCIPIYGYLDPARLPPRGFDLLLNSGKLVFDAIRRHGMNCEAVQNGTLTAAFDERTLATTRAAQKKYAGLGKSDGYLDRKALAAVTGAQGFAGGWIHPDGGHLNPLAYTRELARIAIAMGVEIFTESPMTGLRRQHGQWEVATPSGVLRARTVGLATDAYSTAAVPSSVTRGFFPLDCYGLASRPLDRDEQDAMIANGMNFGDTHRDPLFFRIDASGRIIAGGLREPRRGRDFAYTAERMTRRFSRMFPDLEALRWEHMWSGRISMALDQMPSIEALDDGFFALGGWSGRGVPTSAALSRCFARTLEDPAAGLEYWPTRTPPRVYARRALGQMVQLCRGPFNQMRDRFSL